MFHQVVYGLRKKIKEGQKRGKKEVKKINSQVWTICPDMRGL
jgi:hypothetical protein